ncbi:MAG TPA: oligosaccharide flippase family protein [Gemmatimonadales bacterium]|nr:oligosaccharide flippase family protein [Gemmatimonadales bacterium]
MTTEAISLPRQPGTANRGEGTETNLTWRASLNALQSVLDYSAKLAVNLLIIPILVSGLGRSLFGVWEMLSRLMGYLESADGRPTQSLRLVISNLQSERGPGTKRRWIGAALRVWLWFLPLWMVTGAVVIWLAPAITKVSPPLHGPVRIACAIMMAGVLLGGLATLPESVLRGMNLGYKRMGLQAGLSISAGALLAGAVYLGGGLIGIAAAQVLAVALAGICFLILVRRQVPWFGFERPQPSEVRTLLHMSLWIAAGDAIAKMLLASDVLVLGMVLSPASVTTYVLTGYAALLSTNLHSLAADAVMPGLAGIIGEKDFARAAMLRRELIALTIVFIAGVGSTILLWNQSFVHLWVGSENYAGIWTNLLLVLIAAQTALIRCDAYIIDAALKPGQRVRVSAVAAIIALALSSLLTYYAGLVGLCVGILCGRAVQSLWFPVLVRGCLERPSLRMSWVLRPFAAVAVLFASSAWLGQRVVVDNWLLWAGGVLLTMGLALGAMVGLGLPADAQVAVRNRLKELMRRAGLGRWSGGQ